MVSDIKKAPDVRSAFDKFEMEPLKEPINVRLRFRKVGDLQYISHLDLQRVMSRVLVRSGIPVWFTLGFNPHPKMVFGMPLSVGTQSECEYLDIKVDRKIPLDEIVERINSQVTDELRFKKAYYPKSKLSDIAFVSYSIEIKCDGLSAQTAVDTVKLLRTSPHYIMKKSKSGEKQIDITEYIKDIKAKYSDTLKLELMLTGGEGSLNPEAIVTVLREKLGVLRDYPEKGHYSITRTELYFADGRRFE